MDKEQGFSRRQFFKSTTGGASALILPMYLSSRVLGAAGVPGANDRIRVGVIGVGSRAGLLIDQLPEQAEIVAVADCYIKRCEEAAAKRKASWRIYQDYRKLLEQKDIDAVVVATTEHGRVLPCIHACQAGKDVYAEKPLTICIGEGRTLVKAVRRYKRVLQVGSQQRSMAMNRTACDFIRGGGLGKLKVVETCNYPSSKRCPTLPEQPVPEGLDWDMWQGPTAARPYHHDLQLNWYSWRDYSGGEVANWGAHGLDQVQSALGEDLTGPVELWPNAEGPVGSIAFRYANGVTVKLVRDDGALVGGALFIGENGQMRIERNHFTTDPEGMVSQMPAAEEVLKWTRAQWQAKYHLQNWLDCIKTREKPLADVEIGHRSVSVCHLVNITRELGRKLRWDPKKEQFIGDAEANLLVNRPRRKGYELPKV